MSFLKYTKLNSKHILSKNETQKEQIYQTWTMAH